MTKDELLIKIQQASQSGWTNANHWLAILSYWDIYQESTKVHLYLKLDEEIKQVENKYVVTYS